jgi:hypothetical protein
MIIVLATGFYFFSRHNNVAVEDSKIPVTSNPTSSASWAGIYPANWRSYLSNVASHLAAGHVRFAALRFATFDAGLAK